MKICDRCGQVVAEEVNTCPACGGLVAAGRAAIDDFHILEVLHEGYSSVLCKARQEGEDLPVMIRIFTHPSGVDARLAARLKNELEALQVLPPTYFVRHLAIRQSADGLWYRISEWIEALNWGTLLSTGRLKDLRTSLGLFGQIASILDGLHRIGHIIPHLNLDDILVHEDVTGALRVKVDYKLSRFLDPQLDRPGPMLARLLALHPDIVKRRPLDHRSDIWSLGKIFVELLGADPDIKDLNARAGTLPVPSEIRRLIRLMLSDNPDLRPQSMADVSASLTRVKDSIAGAGQYGNGEDSGKTARTLLRRVNLRLGLLAMVLTVMIAAGGLLGYRLMMRQDHEAALMEYANRYAGAVAFVVVDYWLRQGGRQYYRNRSEGTAFLVDDKGHLLTNRHVACPWLEDRRLMMLIGLLRQRPEKLHFGYRIYLWFDGQRAFSRLPALAGSNEVEDIYVTRSAFSSQGERRVWIAGVAPIPVKTLERVHSPLGDDFAVLKIDKVPQGLQPLPLAEDFSAVTIPKLTPLITLGFPLGRQTQAATVNVSVTSGHVRRTFENMFQVDVSLHPGNSGGPFIDARGRVVGLATTIVSVRWAKGPVPVATPLSDIGMALPINKAAAFLTEIKAGAVKWNGVIDVALDKRLQRITETARRREWEKARALADKELRTAPTPPLVMAAAIMHLCTGDHDGGRRLLDQALSINPGNNMARLMLLVADWLQGGEPAGVHLRFLTALDWRSPDEFLGYLAAILAGEVNRQDAVAGGYTSTEKAWLNLFVGLVEARRGNPEAARLLLERAVLAADIDEWSLYLALSQMDHLQHWRTENVTDPSGQKDHRRQFETFEGRMEKAVAKKKALGARLESIRSALQGDDVELDIKRSLLKRLRGIDRDNINVLIAEAYYAAMDEDWDAALDFARQFLSRPGRTTAGKLSVGLLESEILFNQGNADQARQSLDAYRQRITDHWYLSLSGCLLDPALRAGVTARAGDSPENLLTGHTALGLWAEGSSDVPGAIKHYREALGSYLDQWIEYDFAVARMKRLRQPAQ